MNWPTDPWGHGDPWSNYGSSNNYDYVLPFCGAVEVEPRKIKLPEGSKDAVNGRKFYEVPKGGKIIFHKATETSNRFSVLVEEEPAIDDDMVSVCSDSSAEQEADRINRWQSSIAKDPPSNKIQASAQVDDWDLELLCAYLANKHNSTIKESAREHRLRFWPAVQHHGPI